MNDLQAFEERLAALIANLSPASRKQMAADIAKRLRASQQANIKAQRAPDGTPFAARKTQKIRAKKGRVKREMFTKMRTNKYMKAKATGNDASVEFTGKVQRMARVHHYGLRDKITRNSHDKEVKYDARPLLGFSEDDMQNIESIIISHLAK
ncbi:phage virion morphogenesis protein [Rouxiella chamberiensis]|uniref:Phage virion morphogenesis protein n=1 Tax=Rouxiella chamberiensis TaxID=1513468 RepID=A0ABY7HV94_9GAMM|nr:phage virion morphogenesis protein [Rouxiella chamberiensis]WAT03158.1 phage virion morphogenesis protein [Rouxiella chamberiensis]